MSGIWWTKMEHKEDFCEHFCEMSDKEIVADIRKSINSFLKQRADGADFGAKMVKKALDRITSKHDSAVANGSLGGQATAANKKKIPQDAPNGNAGVDMTDAGNGANLKSATSCDQFTADGDIREDSQAIPDGSAITGNETRAFDALEPSANHYGTRQAKNGDAATREGADGESDGNVATARTTVSRNMRQVPQNEAPAHGFSGGRTAQGIMSRSPEAAAQSGKAYDQETDQVSTDEARQSQTAKTRDTRDDSRGRYAPPSCSPEDGNPAETAPSHGGSVASLDARQGQARQSQGRTGAQALAVRNLPRNKEEVRLFAIDNGLDVDDANDWAEMNLRERHGRDKDGKPIRNWKGAILNYCKAMAAKRETA